MWFSQAKNRSISISMNSTIFRKEDNTYEIQGRTNEGWVSVAMTFKDK